LGFFRTGVVVWGEERTEARRRGTGGGYLAGGALAVGESLANSGGLADGTMPDQAERSKSHRWGIQVNWDEKLKHGMREQKHRG
jgi:hypothetical protein